MTYLFNRFFFDNGFIADHKILMILCCSFDKKKYIRWYNYGRL